MAIKVRDIPGTQWFAEIGLGPEWSRDRWKPVAKAVLPSEIIVAHVASVGRDPHVMGYAEDYETLLGYWPLRREIYLPFRGMGKMRTNPKVQAKGMWYDEKEGSFKTKHLTMYFDFDTGEVRVEGPKDFTDTWLDIPKAVKSAELSTPYVPSPGWALAHAIHEQWSEYRGYMEERAWRER